MNLLVTGGCGFIGSAFIRARLGASEGGPARLVNLDALTYAGNPANVASVASDPRYVFVRGSIGDEELVHRLLREHAIDAVVNFAAETHVDRSIDNPWPFVETNVLGTYALLRAATRHWKELPEARRAAFRLLHVSTDEVYGMLGPGDPAFREDTAYAPNSPYSASKAAADHFVRAWHHTYGLPTLTTNCSNNYGPFLFPEKLIPLVILNALDGRALPIYGDGRQVRDWLHVDDHAEALRTVLARGVPGRTYCVGGNNERHNIDVVHRVCDLLDRRAPRADGVSYRAQITHVADRPGHDRRYAVDGTRLRDELGWSPRVRFEDGLAAMVDWYVDNRAWCTQVTQEKYNRTRLGLAAARP